MLKDDVIRGLLELVDAGYPESVAKRIASGELPMDNASRMARAAEQGYDMTPQYHGSQSDILEFRPSSDGKMGAGVYTSDNPEVANRYASGISGDNVTPLLLRGQSINRKDAIAANPDMRREPGETNRDMFQRLANIVQGGGYDRMDIGGPAQGNMIRESVTYNPENIRSLLSAAFDPEYKGRNILGASAGAGTAGLLGAGAMQSENAAASEDTEQEIDRVMRLTDEMEREDKMRELFAATGSPSLGKVALDLVSMPLEAAGKEIAGLSAQALRSLYLGITGKPKDEQSVYSNVTSDEFMPETYSPQAIAVRDNIINPMMQRAGDAFVENVVMPAAGTDPGQAAIGMIADGVQYYQGMTPRQQNFADAAGAGLLAALSLGTGGRARPSAVIPEDELIKLIGRQ